MSFEFVCRICGNNNCKKFLVKEMQFGMQDEFDYYECLSCGCLQISEYPENISKYYPDKYFSYGSPREGKFIKEKLNICRDKASLGLGNFIGEFLLKRYGVPTFIKRLKVINVRLDDKIMDVGCGSGKLLYRMGNAGFSNLLGIDPYIEKDVTYKNGVKIQKKTLYEIDGKFDLISLHHTLEHMSNHHQVMKKLNSLLNPGKHLIVGIPLASSWAWRNYGVNWVNLDAPRHFYLHTIISLRHLADKYGFQIFHSMYDSLGSQFLGSEQYTKGIPLYSEKSFLVNSDNSIFTKKDFLQYEERAKQLNAENDGDRACFFLKKVKNL